MDANCEGTPIRISDLKVCGGWLEWEEYRELRRQNLVDGLQEVFEPKTERAEDTQ